MEIMHTDKAPAAVGPYSQAVKTGNLLFCSGQIGLNPSTGEMVGTTVAEQAKQVMENVKALLENAGATFDNVVKTTCFIADMKEFGNFNEVYAQYFSNNKPARSCVAVKTLPKNVLCLSGEYLHDCIGDQCKTNTMSDRSGDWHRD